jgi:hypothetical protein
MNIFSYYEYFLKTMTKWNILNNSLHIITSFIENKYFSSKN